MPRTAKIAISLPEDILQVIEQERKAKGESRSEFFRRAIEAFLRQQQERITVEQYVQGYRQMPETIAEIQAVHQAGVAVLVGEPWNETR
jgi:Ribbon-helix-helix protein, copG family.